jgi:hypothetical protein
MTIVVWIDTRYNRRSRRRVPGKLTPVAFDVTYAAEDEA